MKILKIFLKGEDFEPTQSDLDYINTLGEDRALKLFYSVEIKLEKILKIRQSNELQKEKP